MTFYQTIYGDHILSYYERIIFTLRAASNNYPRTLVLRVDLHDPAIIEHGDMVTCFPAADSTIRQTGLSQYTPVCVGT